ncbi:uncharacterized protein LOC106085673 [Stomoxys calcitrans]|uniref:uncharacterized protein LOC106085673 n=1 Tax=Stomoxys calcitrans TaxID=35570 RepID=UPI0027E2A9C0|nr:uncharacterized protein LOC106085673 [Stomoxys calcitrans]
MDMELIDVPKKVNRHVMKALSALSNGNVFKKFPLGLILEQVERQMRNVVPVDNLEDAVTASLHILSYYGLIRQFDENRFDIGRSYDEIPSTPTKKDFSLDDSRKRTYSTDSMSGDEFDKTRKRMRSNNKNFRFKGRRVELPKPRRHTGFLFQTLDSFEHIELGKSHCMNNANNFELAINMAEWPAVGIDPMGQDNANIDLRKDLEVLYERPESRENIHANSEIHNPSNDNLNSRNQKDSCLNLNMNTVARGHVIEDNDPSDPVGDPKTSKVALTVDLLNKSSKET